MNNLLIHALASKVPAMPHDEHSDLVRDIHAHGQRQPIVLYEGQILDGRHRYQACRELGIKPATEVFTGTEAEARDYVWSMNVYRRHLTIEQRQGLIEAELRRDPGQTDRTIAEKVNASPTTVGKTRKKMEAAGDVSIVDTRTDTKGRKQRAHKPPTAKATPRERQERAVDTRLSQVHIGSLIKEFRKRYFVNLLGKPERDSVVLMAMEVVAHCYRLSLDELEARLAAGGIALSDGKAESTGGAPPR